MSFSFSPKSQRTRKPVPTEDETRQFFTYVYDRFPDWTSLHALLNLKAVSASRTADVCQLKTAQLVNGSITFGADITKTKEARSLPLPPELFRTLTEVAGDGWLWEGLFAELPKFRKQSNGLPDAFDWRTVYRVVMNIFREYGEAFPTRPKFSPHGLRRRAITATVKMTGSVDAAASAIGVNAQTARTHYLDATRAFDTADTMRRVGSVLLMDKSTIKAQSGKGTGKKPKNKGVKP